MYATFSAFKSQQKVCTRRKMSNDMVKSLDDSIARLQDTEAILLNACMEKDRLEQRISELQSKKKITDLLK